MAISWDFTAAAKAQAAGQAASARESANAIKSVQQGFATRETRRRNQEIERVNQERAAAAQQGVVDKFNKETADTFNIPAGTEGKDYGNVNEIFDYSANSLVKTYTRIYNDKDMDRDERALALKKLTNQIPLFKTAQAALNKNIGSYAEGALTGSISKAMPPEFQEMYEELSNGNFDGGIDYIDGETRLVGSTKGGHEINLPLRDFAKNLPPIENSQGTITDSLDAERLVYKTQHELYMKDPMKNPLPVWNQKEQEAKISEQIAGIDGNGLKIYGMDVLNYTAEEMQQKIDQYKNGDISRDAIPEKTLLSLDPSQQSRFGPDTSKMTEPEAIVYVTEDLAEEMAGIQKKYLDQTNYLKPFVAKAKPNKNLYDQNLLNEISSSLAQVTDFDPESIGIVNDPGEFNMESLVEISDNGKTIVKISQEAIPYPVDEKANEKAETKEEAKARNKISTFDLTNKADVREILQKQFNQKASAGGFAPGTARDNLIINGIDQQADAIVKLYTEKQNQWAKDQQEKLTQDPLYKIIEDKKKVNDMSWRMDQMNLDRKMTKNRKKYNF
jgi:hypothetical protein